MTLDEKSDLIQYLLNTDRDLGSAISFWELKDEKSHVEAELIDDIFKCCRCGKWLDVALESDHGECIGCSESD